MLNLSDEQAAAVGLGFISVGVCLVIGGIYLASGAPLACIVAGGLICWVGNIIAD